MYFDNDKSLVFIPINDGTPFMEGETVADGVVLNKYCDVEKNYFVYSFCSPPTPPNIEFEDIDPEDIPDWV